MTQTLDYHQWNEMSYEHALTIKDILSLKPGDVFKVLCMDRNVWDGALNDEIRGKSCTPMEFFKDNWAIYIHEENLKGKALIFAFECEGNIDDVDIDKMSINDLCQPNFEFHLEYKPYCWYPLKEGYLPEIDPQGLCNFPWTDGQKYHWTSFPDSTRVGWRGQFILWSKLKDMPNIIYPYSKNMIKAFDNECDITTDRSFKIQTDVPIINTICTEFDFNKRESHKWAAYGFMWHVREKVEDNKMGFPITFEIDVIETTEKSKKQIIKYSVTCESDGECINGMRKLGKNHVVKIKN